MYTLDGAGFLRVGCASAGLWGGPGSPAGPGKPFPHAWDRCRPRKTLSRAWAEAGPGKPEHRIGDTSSEQRGFPALARRAELLGQDPVDDVAVAFHAAKPCHLAFGELVDGVGEVFAHVVVGDFADDVLCDELIFKAIVD